MSTSLFEVRAYALVLAFFAAWGWSIAYDLWGSASLWMEVLDCTFSCNATTVTGFWDAVSLSAFLTATSTLLAFVSVVFGRSDRDEVLSVEH